MSSTASDLKCQYCGGVHAEKCPLVTAIEFYPDGAVKRVEFIKPEPVIAQDPKFGLSTTWVQP